MRRWESGRQSRQTLPDTGTASAPQGKDGHRPCDRPFVQSPASFCHLRLIPLHVQRHGNNEVATRYQRLGFGVGFWIISSRLIRGDHPYIAYIIATELAFWIRAFERGGKKSRGRQLSDEVFVVVIV